MPDLLEVRFRSVYYLIYIYNDLRSVAVPERLLSKDVGDRSADIAEQELIVAPFLFKIIYINYARLV